MLRHSTTSGTVTLPSTAHHVIEATHSLHPVGRVLERIQGLGVAPPDFPWPPHARHGLLIDVLLQQTGWDWAGCTRCLRGASSGLHAARPSQGRNPQCPGMPPLGCAAATHTGCTQPSSSWAQRQPPPCKCSWGSSQERPVAGSHIGSAMPAWTRLLLPNHCQLHRAHSNHLCALAHHCCLLSPLPSHKHATPTCT